ncbi:MAG: hypothetical protein ACTSVV_12735 [Promethearchaeota archaeon]
MQIITLIAYLTIFVILLSFIWIFLIIQTFKVNKIARRFLLSMAIYFLLMTLANLMQIFYYLEKINIGKTGIEGKIGIYNSPISIIFGAFAPFYFIFQIEKHFFPKWTIFSKHHLISIILVILISLIFGYFIYFQIRDPNFLFEEFEMRSLWFIIYPAWALVVLFIISTFLVFGIKTTNKYRFYSFMIFIGWTTNQLANIYIQLTDYNLLTELVILIIFSLKYTGTILTALGFYRLYNLKR